MSRDISRLRPITELVAAVGVVLSLLLVALEISQNTASVRAQTRQQLSDANSQFLVALATTELAELWTGFGGGEELGEREYDKLTIALIAGLRGVENVYLQHLEGVVDESALSSYGWSGSFMYASDPFADWWRDNRGRFHPAFVEAFTREYNLDR